MTYQKVKDTSFITFLGISNGQDDFHSTYSFDTTLFWSFSFAKVKQNIVRITTGDNNDQNHTLELLYFFVAEYTPQMKVSEGGGIAEETENIKVLELPFAAALEMMSDGRIRDGKTIMLLQYALTNGLLS